MQNERPKVRSSFADLLLEEMRRPVRGDFFHSHFSLFFLEKKSSQITRFECNLLNTFYDDENQRIFQEFVKFNKKTLNIIKSL